MFCIGWTLLWPSEPKKTEPFFCRVGVYILLCSWIVQFENVRQTLQIFTQMSHQALWLTMSTLEDHMLISIWKIIMWISSELSNCPVLCSHTRVLWVAKRHDICYQMQRRNRVRNFFVPPCLVFFDSLDENGRKRRSFKRLDLIRSW